MNPSILLFASGALLPLVLEPAALPPVERAHAVEESSADSRRPISDPPVSSPRFPEPETLEFAGAVIGSITIDSGNIFDREQPGESFRLFRLANRLHFKTRDRVIESFLLLEEGAPYTRIAVEESARILRSQRYLYDATIEPTAWDGHRVDLRVETRDVWTLKVGVSLNRGGGKNDTDIVLQDSNFLGSGKEITFKRSSGVDRTGYLLRYYDPNLFATRADLELDYADNSDGEFTKVRLRRRFFSLETRRAGGLEYINDLRTDSIYNLGEVSWEFEHDETFLEAWTGISKGLVDGHARRWLAGLTFEEHTFRLETARPDSLPAPRDRTLSYPWIGFQSAPNRYLKAHDLNLIGRTEDLLLGHTVSARVGWSSPIFGGDRDQAVFNGSYTFGILPRPNHLLYFDSRTSGRWGESGRENLLLSASARYFWRNFGEHALFASLSFDFAENLDPEKQLLLGGDSGLRGYPLRFQEGDRRVLLTVEQRFYTPWHLLRLAHVGAALFVDAGRAWTPGRPSESDRGTLLDLGLGLRISPSRSGFGSIVHLDVAFPLDGDGSIDRVQWLISAKETF